MSKQTLDQQLPPVRLTSDEKTQLQTLAEDDNRTLSNYVRTVLIEHLNGNNRMAMKDATYVTKTETVTVGDMATSTSHIEEKRVQPQVSVKNLTNKIINIDIQDETEQSPPESPDPIAKAQPQFTTSRVVKEPSY